MGAILAKALTLAGSLVAIAVGLLQYLIPLYPAANVDEAKVNFNLALIQYGVLLLALGGAGLIARRTESKPKKIRLIILILTIIIVADVSMFSGHAKTTQTLSIDSTHYRFTTDWVSRNEHLWTAILQELRGRADIHALEIGSFEGRSALWFLENILTHPAASITCVDIFAGDTRNDSMPMLKPIKRPIS
jgi:hypothetical protein